MLILFTFIVMVLLALTFGFLLYKTKKLMETERYLAIIQRNSQEREAEWLNDKKDEWVFWFNTLAGRAAKTAKDHGWDEKPSSDGEMIALMHSELSEALENLRTAAPHEDDLTPDNREVRDDLYTRLGDEWFLSDDHCPDFAGVEVELADVIIRIMHNSYKRGYRVAEALKVKMAYNDTRPYKHGGKAF